MFIQKRKTIPVLLSALLVACGGGGGSPAGSSPVDSRSSQSSDPNPAATGSGTSSPGQTGDTSPAATGSGTSSPGQTGDSATGGGNNQPPTANSGNPAIAAHWSLREIPRANAYPTTYFKGINDKGDAVGYYVSGVNSGGRLTTGANTAYANGTVTDLGTLAGQAATLSGINNAGQIVGTYGFNIYDMDHSRRGPWRAFLYENGTSRELPVPAQAGIDPSKISTYAAQLNNHGEVVGYSSFTDASGIKQNRAFVFANGVSTTIAPPSAENGTIANAINDSGTVVGDIQYLHENGINGMYRSTGFAYHAGIITDLGTLPGYPASDAADINNSGQIAGTAYNMGPDGPENHHPFLYENGNLREIPLPPGAEAGAATGINGAGQIVGTLYGGRLPSPMTFVGGFLHSGGKSIDLNTLPEVIAAGITVIEAVAINEAGQILVHASRSSGDDNYVYYLLSPIQ